MFTLLLILLSPLLIIRTKYCYIYRLELKNFHPPPCRALITTGTAPRNPRPQALKAASHALAATKNHSVVHLLFMPSGDFAKGCLAGFAISSLLYM
jgi:hypothetical protein